MTFDKIKPQQASFKKIKTSFYKTAPFANYFVVKFYEDPLLIMIQCTNYDSVHERHNKQFPFSFIDFEILMIISLIAQLSI